MPEMEIATTFSASSPSHRHNFFTYSNSKSFNFNFFTYSCQPFIFPPFHPHRPSLPIRLRSRCLSAGPCPPSPPDFDPPHSPGFAGKLSRFQDRAQIFFAFLFWMSLFFWSSAWDGRNSGGPNKGSRFRR